MHSTNTHPIVIRSNLSRLPGSKPFAAFCVTALLALASTARADGTIEQILDEVADPLGQIERQIETREYDFAIRWLEEHVLEIESSANRYDSALVRPLTLLGDAYMGKGEPAAALGQYDRAVHLSRVNSGLNSPEQVAIVYREADAYRSLGDYEMANAREEYAYHVLTRSYDPHDEALLPGTFHLARWYEATGNPFAARALYRHAEEVIIANDEQSSPALIPALAGIARTYRLERFPPFYSIAVASSDASVSFEQPVVASNFPDGEAALQQIVQIQQERDDSDPMTVAEAILDLADWYTLFDKNRRANALYEHAYGMLASVPDFDAVDYFAEPKLLYFPSPGNPKPPPVSERGEARSGYVEVAYRVTDDGYVREMQTIASEPEGMMDFRVRKSLRLARYRPMLVDGVPIDREAHTYRHEFTYYPKLEEIQVGQDVGDASDAG